MYPSSNLTGEASIHPNGNFSCLAEFATDGLKKKEKKKKHVTDTSIWNI